MTNFVLIEGKVQPYQWGGFNFIPDLLSGNQTPSPENSSNPSAEYWLGDHPSAPSLICDNSVSEKTINQYLKSKSAPPLQFLFKILDVKDMLSIQSHPTMQQAKDGYVRENQQGISLTAKNRNYKDECDKPELMVALSEFWLLHGIKPIAKIEQSLATKPYLAPLLGVLKEHGLTAAFEFALNLENETVGTMHAHLTEDFSTATSRQEKFTKDNIDFWIHRWISQNPDTVNGILTLYFLNLIKMKTGEAIYQPPGLLHAYLEGQNVELMANSDNVLRAGLTPKHIDVAELLNTCNLNSSNPSDYIIQQRLKPNQIVEYTTPFEAFKLEELSSSRSKTVVWQSKQPEILFCYKGTAKISSDHGQNHDLNTGEALLILPGSNLTAVLDAATLYKARNRVHQA